MGDSRVAVAEVMNTECMDKIVMKMTIARICSKAGFWVYALTVLYCEEAEGSELFNYYLRILVYDVCSIAIYNSSNISRLWLTISSN